MITENQYFDGQVKSLGYQTSAGKSTVGVIDPGEYEFGTAQKEIMNVIEGTLEVLFSGKTDWETYKAGSFFEVPANDSFKVKAIEPTAYLCQYR